jgi:hypothetical protein
MKPGGQVQQPYSYTRFLALIDCLKIPALIPASSYTVKSWAADEAVLNKIQKTKLQ